MSVSRQQLYEEVWAEPMTKVAKRYGVSSSFLARVCSRLNVPRPARGVWAKREAGQAIERPALPPPRPGDEIEWPRENREPRWLPRELPKPPADAATSPVAMTAVSGQHPLIVVMRDALATASVSRGGYLRSAKKLVPDIFVSKESLDRALALANRVFQIFEKRGHRVVLAPKDESLRRASIELREDAGERHSYWAADPWTPARPTVIFVGTVAVGLALYEVSEEVEMKSVGLDLVRAQPFGVGKRPNATGRDRLWVDTRPMANGRLALRAYSPYRGTSWSKEWRETRGDRLSAKVEEIVVNVEAAAGAIAAEVETAVRRDAEERRQAEAARVEQERAERAAQEPQRKREQEKQREEEKRRRIEGLRAQVERWNLARQVREYVNDLRHAVEDEGCVITPGAELAAWMEWALGYADSIDPVRPLRTEARSMIRRDMEKIEALAVQAGVELAPEDEDAQ